MSLGSPSVLGGVSRPSAVPGFTWRCHGWGVRRDEGGADETWGPLVGENSGLMILFSNPRWFLSRGTVKGDEVIEFEIAYNRESLAIAPGSVWDIAVGWAMEKRLRRSP